MLHSKHQKFMKGQKEKNANTIQKKRKITFSKEALGGARMLAGNISPPLSPNNSIKIFPNVEAADRDSLCSR
jgi:hypothetical protein